MELCLWFVFFLCSRFERLQYVFYVLNGYGFWVKDPKTDKPQFRLTLSNIIYRLRHGLVTQRADLVLNAVNGSKEEKEE